MASELTKQEKLTALLNHPGFKTLPTQDKIRLLAEEVDPGTDWLEILMAAGMTDPNQLAQEHEVNMAQSDPDVLQRSARRGLGFENRLEESVGALFEPETYGELARQTLRATPLGLMTEMFGRGVARMEGAEPELADELASAPLLGPAGAEVGDVGGRLMAGDPEAEGALGADLAFGAGTAVVGGGLSKPMLPAARAGPGLIGRLGMGRPSLRMQQAYRRLGPGSADTYAEASANVKQALRLDRERTIQKGSRTVPRGLEISNDLDTYLPRLHSFAKAEGLSVGNVRDFSQLARAAAEVAPDPGDQAALLRIADQAEKTANLQDLELGVAKGQSTVRRIGTKIAEAAAASLFPGGKLRRLALILKGQSPDHSIRRAFTKMDLADPSMPEVSPFRPDPVPEASLPEPTLKFGLTEPSGSSGYRAGLPDPANPFAPTSPPIDETFSRRVAPAPKAAPTVKPPEPEQKFGPTEPSMSSSYRADVPDPSDPFAPQLRREVPKDALVDERAFQEELFSRPERPAKAPSDISESPKSSAVVGGGPEPSRPQEGGAPAPSPGTKPRIRAHFGSWPEDMPPGQPVRITPLQKDIQNFQRWRGDKPPRVPPRHGRAWIPNPFERRRR